MSECVCVSVCVCVRARARVCAREREREKKLEFIKAYPVEIDHTSEVCVMRPWVLMIFSMSYYTHHRCRCTYVVQEENLLL